MVDSTEHISLIRDCVRNYIAKEVPLALASKWDREDCFPRAAFDRFGKLGLCGLSIPEEYGGVARDWSATLAVIEELAHRSIALASAYIMSACYGGINIYAAGSEAQKKELLPKIAAGELLFSYGLSEPNVGADLASVQCVARIEADRVIIQGTKRWCTGSNIADYIFCLVRSGSVTERYKNLSMILVPTNTQGISFSASPTMGFKGLATNDVNFDSVSMSIDNILGGLLGWNRGWEMLTGSALEVEKIEVAAMALGIAKQATEDAWQYAQEREQFGKRISSLQSIRHSLADCKTTILACELMVSHAARQADLGRLNAAESSMVKNFVAENAVTVVLNCQKIMGAYGYSTEFSMERFVRDVLVMPIFGGSTSIHKNNISNRLGLKK